MSKEYPTYSYDKYEGHSNEQIKSLYVELDKVQQEVIRIAKQIDDIQDNCVHEYKLVAKGMYEDAYSCEKCGHQKWK